MVSRKAREEMHHIKINFPLHRDRLGNKYDHLAVLNPLYVELLCKNFDKLQSSRHFQTHVAPYRCSGDNANIIFSLAYVHVCF